MLLLQLAAMICVHDEVSTTYTTLSGGQVYKRRYKRGMSMSKVDPKAAWKLYTETVIFSL